MKKQSLLITLASIAILLAGSMPSKAQVLTTNGNFQTQVLLVGTTNSTITDWALNNGSVFLHYPGTLQAPLYQNIAFMQPGTQISQTFAVSLLASTTYTVSYDYYMAIGTPTGNTMNAYLGYGTGTGAGSVFAANIIAGDLASGQTSLLAPVTTSAQTASFTFTTKASITGSVNNLCLALQPAADGGEAIWVDNVIVTAVPEPGTFALVAGTGLAAWLLRRRRLS